MNDREDMLIRLMLKKKLSKVTMIIPGDPCADGMPAGISTSIFSGFISDNVGSIGFSPNMVVLPDSIVPIASAAVNQIQ